MMMGVCAAAEETAAALVHPLILLAQRALPSSAHQSAVLTAVALPFSAASPLRRLGLGLSSRPGLEGLRPRFKGDL
jgi:hypothetical protein